MQNCFGLLVADVMPIQMIMPRYSHNYLLFYQLLDSNLFTHCNTYAILREASSETYGPRVYLLSYLLPIYFYLHLYFLLLYYKNTKNIFILSYYLYQISLSQVAVKGLTTPNRVGCEQLLFCAGTRDLSMASYQIDTLVLKN